MAETPTYITVAVSDEQVQSIAKDATAQLRSDLKRVANMRDDLADQLNRKTAHHRSAVARNGALHTENEQLHRRCQSAEALAAERHRLIEAARAAKESAAEQYADATRIHNEQKVKLEARIETLERAVAQRVKDSDTERQLEIAEQQVAALVERVDKLTAERTAAESQKYPAFEIKRMTDRNGGDGETHVEIEVDSNTRVAGYLIDAGRYQMLRRLETSYRYVPRTWPTVAELINPPAPQSRMIFPFEEGQ